MALTSPGVQVSVIDESFYTPAEPGTRPLFIVASAQDKTNGAGTGTASGTLAANAGKVYLMTSQRDLVDTFGTINENQSKVIFYSETDKKYYYKYFFNNGDETKTKILPINSDLND
jgi:hypothetical protein